MSSFDDERPRTGGSIRRARERAQDGGQRESFGTFTRNMEQLAAMQWQQEQGQDFRTFSPQRPFESPHSLPNQGQWPLAGPVAATEPAPYQPPPGRSQPPRRPPRPSHVPSILDSAKMQDQMTAYAYNAANPAAAAAEQQYLLNQQNQQNPTQTQTQTQTSGLQPPPRPVRRESDQSIQQSQQSYSSSASRASTISSVASIPDFPLPDFPLPTASASRPAISPPAVLPQTVPSPVVPPPPPRRSINLGPPPSARRGASSFYSANSFVSPIPEESPRVGTRSHASYASSAAIPTAWGSSSSLALSPQYTDQYPESGTFYENIPEEGRLSVHTPNTPNSPGTPNTAGSRSGGGSPDTFGDEHGLVRSASIGERGRAAIIQYIPGAAVSNNTNNNNNNNNNNLAVPESTSASGGSRSRSPSLSASNILDAYDAASSSDPSNPDRRLSISPQPPVEDANAPTSQGWGAGRMYSRLSAIRRPPRLDMDAVRKAEARGSLTSLPDLIRRATRLAADLERGKRPASRTDDLNMSPGTYARALALAHARNGSNPNMTASEADKYRSGLSDMLAAFPPPGQPGINTRRSIRQSFRDTVGSWPVPYGASAGANSAGRAEAGYYTASAEGKASGDKQNGKSAKRRRCCGLPMWGFVLVVLVILMIVAAAIVIPLEFFVLRKPNSSTGSALAQCESQLTCANGGTNVVSAQGFCACICANGFTGFDCSVADSVGCTTTSLSTANGSLSDVTLGTAIPRLLTQAQANFSVALSAADVLGAFSSGNLSCASENALVTFDGASSRTTSAALNVALVDDLAGAVMMVSGVAVAVVTVTATAQVQVKRDTASTLTIDAANAASTIVLPSSTTTVTTTVTPTTLLTAAPRSTKASTSTGTSTAPSASASVSVDTFVVTDDVVDFARVAVLFVLQEDSLASATAAQSALQSFFGGSPTADAARNLSLANGNSVNLVALQVAAGATLQGVGVGV